jgi:hypothetical protein
MSRQGGVAGNASDAAQRGLWRLMLKLPAMRGRLQILAARSRRLDDLFEAYEEASRTLERLRKEDDVVLAKEYDTVCSDIEADVIRYVLQGSAGVPD